jgi:hypothetical protein
MRRVASFSVHYFHSVLVQQGFPLGTEFFIGDKNVYPGKRTNTVKCRTIKSGRIAAEKREK